jgi:hypothetical protein
MRFLMMLVNFKGYVEKTVFEENIRVGISE